MRTPLRVLAQVLFCLGAVVIVAGAEPPHAAPAQRRGQAKLEDSLAVRLLGSWVLEKATTPGKPSGIGTRMKTFGDGRWEIIQRDPTTHEVIFQHGGSYRIEGDILIQTVEFAGARTRNYIGRVSKFRVIVDKDTYTQIALDSQFNEVWKRVDDV